jgi:hypothetical protein
VIYRKHRPGRSDFNWCTGFSEQITEDKAKKMGIKKFILKPMVMRKLALTVREVLDGG